MDFLGLFAGLSGVFGLIMMALFLLIPFMIYLNQRNTYQISQELRKTNKKLDKLIDMLAQHHKPPESKTKATEKPESKQAGLAKTTCPECKEEFQYPAKYKGQYKKCPLCHNKIILT